MSDPTAGLGSEGPGEPILELASDCDDLIQSCLGLAGRDGGGHVNNLVEAYERRFAAWWGYIGVFAGKGANLDRRLRHHVQIRDLVLRLLLILSRNLGMLRECLLLSDHAPAREGVSAGHPQGDPDVEMTDVSSNLDVAHNAIDEALAELSQVGIAIRRSGRTTETIRARQYAATHPDLAMFEATAFLAVETLYPNAPESLQAQLSRSMVDRYARLLYRASRRGILSTDSRKQATQPEQSLDSNVSASQPQSTNVKPPTIQHSRDFAPPRLPGGQIPAPSDFIPTSLDSKSFRARLDRLRLPRSRAGATTAVLGQTHEPPIPQYDGNLSATCRWCFQIIPQAFVANGQWTPEGRDHYRVDLHPFVCISEDCDVEQPIFPSLTAWREHMTSHHPCWVQLVHNQPMWKCPFDHESEALFPSPDHLYAHFEALHDHQDICDNENETFTVQLANDSMVDGQRPPNVCPLCGFTPEGMETLGTAVVKGKQTAAARQRRETASTNRTVTFSDKFPSAGPSASDPEPGAQGNAADSPDVEMGELIPVSRAMETHIAGHLQFLMLLSLRLVDTQTIESDTVSESGSMTPMESGSGCQTGSRMDWDLDDMPSLPTSTPSRSPSPVLPEDSDAKSPTLQTTLTHRDSRQVDNMQEDQNMASSPTMADNPLVEQDGSETSVDKQVRVVEESRSADLGERSTTSVKLDKHKRTSKADSEKDHEERSWSDWTDWTWDQDSARWWRARQDSQGRVEYDIHEPGETAPRGYDDLQNALNDVNLRVGEQDAGYSHPQEDGYTYSTSLTPQDAASTSTKPVQQVPTKGKGKAKAAGPRARYKAKADAHHAERRDYTQENPDYDDDPFYAKHSEQYMSGESSSMATAQSDSHPIGEDDSTRPETPIFLRKDPHSLDRLFYDELSERYSVRESSSMDTVDGEPYPMPENDSTRPETPTPFNPDDSFYSQLGERYTAGESSSMATLDSEPYPMSEDDSTRPETPRPSTQSLATEEQPAERQPEEFHDEYVVEHGSRYRPGEVFKIVWCEPRPGGGAGGRDNWSTAAVRLGRNTTPEPSFYQGIRRFIVVANDEGHCTCVPILTYERQACTKRGVKPLKHGIVYPIGKRPRLLAREPQLGFSPVRVDLYERSERLVKESRVNYSKLVTVQHNFKVFFIGRVVEEDFQSIVIPAVDQCWQKKKRG